MTTVASQGLGNAARVCSKATSRAPAARAFGGAIASCGRPRDGGKIEGVDPKAFFVIGNPAGSVDLRTEALRVKQRRMIPGPFPRQVALSLWVLGKRGVPGYELLSIRGTVRLVDGAPTLLVSSADRPTDANNLATKREPGWGDTPLFGRAATLTIESSPDLEVEGGEAIPFRLPTLRFGEMTEGLTLKLGSTITNAPSHIESGIIKAGDGGSLKAVFDDELATRRASASDADKAVLQSIAYLIRATETGKSTSVRRKKANHLETVVLHSTAASKRWLTPTSAGARLLTAAEIPKMFDVDTVLAKMWAPKNLGAHFAVTRDGEVHELVHPRHVANHGRTANGPGHVGNSYSVGIELMGHSPQFHDELKTHLAACAAAAAGTPEKAYATAWETFVDGQSEFWGYTAAQHEAVGLLIKSLGRRYGYIRVIRHSGYDNGKKDPGPAFDNEHFKDDLVEGTWVANFSDGTKDMYMVKGKGREERR